MSFYKYKSLADSNIQYSMDIIENNRLHLSSYDELNDPLEGTYIMPTGFAGCTAYYDTYKIHPHYKDVLDRLGIISLTTSANNIVMWSHYADRFRGICIEFDDQQTLKACKKVIYTFEKSQKISNPDEAWADNPMLHVGKMAVCYKAIGWEYEDEYRYIQEIDPKDKESHFLNLREGEIKGVYLGYALSGAIMNDFEKICRKRNIPLYVAYIAPERFEVDYCTLDEFKKCLSKRGMVMYKCLY